MNQVLRANPRLLKALTRKVKLGLPEQYIPYAPSPKQHFALMLSHIRDVFYGGAAGGGKSDWLLFGAVRYVKEPGYAALLLRRTFADLVLPGALISRSHEWWADTPASWNGSKKQWTFPSGATITFGYLKSEAHKYRYKGGEFQHVGFDEATQFEGSQINYLFSRQRRKLGVNVPLQMRLASNPGQVGHEYVKKRYITERVKGCFFVPAKVEDNPGLDIAGYIESLSYLPEDEIERLLKGNWDAKPSGGVFEEWWFDLLDGMDGQTLPSHLRLIRHWDLAGTRPNENNRNPDWTAGVLFGWDPIANEGYILDVQRFRDDPGAVLERIEATAEADADYFGRAVTVSIEQEPGQSGKSQVAQYKKALGEDREDRGLVPFKVMGHCPRVSKLQRAAPVSALARPSATHDGRIHMAPLPIVVERNLDQTGRNGQYVFGAWMEAFLNEIGIFDGKSDKKKDDQVDGLTGAFAQVFQMDEAPMPMFVGELKRGVALDYMSRHLVVVRPDEGSETALRSGQGRIVIPDPVNPDDEGLMML